MKTFGLCLVVILSATTMAAAQPADAQDLEKKVKKLQDEVNDLQRKRAAMIMEWERQQNAREEAEKKKRYAKVEIRGKLVKAAALENAVVWRVVSKDVTMTLRFEGKQDWDLEKHLRKEVIITGRMVAGSPFVSASGDPPFPRPIHDMRFNPEFAQRYDEAKRSYEELVKVRDAVTRQIWRAVDWNRLPLSDYGAFFPLSDPGIEMPVALVVESLKLAEK
ncbi:MAG: hypothetical protein HY289_14780 [Planctomycetes bacterium]|nr:hypothetical protein [Planctomycetota bacterium]